MSSDSCGSQSIFIYDPLQSEDSSGTLCQFSPSQFPPPLLEDRVDFQATFLKTFSLKLLTKELKLRDLIFIVGMGVSD